MSADLALLVDNPSVIERAADPGEFIIQACERAKTWLREALDHGDIEQIAECKSQADAVRVYTMSKQLGKDAQLSATEIVRRAERGIGVAIRRGQENGTIQGNGRPSSKTFDSGESLPHPRDFASKGELYGGGKGGKVGIYSMTDDVTNADFENALSEAREEGDLSRANVHRKLHRSEPGVPAPGDRRGDAPVQRRNLIRQWAAEGYSSRQMSERLGTRVAVVRRIAQEIGVSIHADEVIGKTRHHDSNRIVRETVHALEGLAMGIQLVDPDDLDPTQAQDWAVSLTESIRALNRLIKTMKEIAQ
jgi:hypothetical protein